MEWVLIWFACGIVGAIIGGKKGEGCGAFIICMIFGPLGILFAVLSSGNRRKCPACKEMINNEATLCPHCRSPTGFKA